MDLPHDSSRVTTDRSPPPDDPHTTGKIGYPEAFRTARRNALFWMAATVLLAIGTSGREEPMTSGIFLDLELAPKLLVLASLGVLVFMAFGFLHAHLRLATYHSPGAVENDLATSFEIAEHIAVKLESAQQAVESLEQAANSEKAGLIHLITEADHALGEIDSALTDKEQPYEWRDYIFDDGDNALDFNVLRERLHQLRNQASKDMMRRSQTAHQSFERFKGNVQSTITAASQVVAEPRARVDSELPALARLPAELRSVSRRLDQGERRWYYWFEVGPVYVMTLIALGLGVVRLVDTDALVSFKYWDSAPQSSNSGTGASGSTEPTP